MPECVDNVISLCEPDETQVKPVHNVLTNVRRKKSAQKSVKIAAKSTPKRTHRNAFDNEVAKPPNESMSTGIVFQSPTKKHAKSVNSVLSFIQAYQLQSDVALVNSLHKKEQQSVCP